MIEVEAWAASMQIYKLKEISANMEVVVTQKILKECVDKACRGSNVEPRDFRTWLEVN